MLVRPEKRIELAIEKRLKTMGYLVLRLSFVGRRGFPDLTVVNDGKVISLEVKRNRGGRISANQYNVSDLLFEAGWPVHFVTGVESAVQLVVEQLG